MSVLKNVGNFFLGVISLIAGLALVLGIPVAVFAGGFPYINGTELYVVLKALIYIGGVIGAMSSVVIGIRTFSFGLDFIKL